MKPRKPARRTALAVAAAALAMIAAWGIPGRTETKETDAMNKNEKTTPAGAACETACGLPQSDEELRKLLTPEQYKIMRENGTERPFANEYWDNHEKGVYVDRITGAPLFVSNDKFDSGTGWPSFTRPAGKEAVTEIRDRSHGMERVEIRSKSSDSHLGHVFTDGPAPTGLRYCMNSASLRFVPVAKLADEGLGSFLPRFGLAAPAAKTDSPAKSEVASFGAGCFWGVEENFRTMPGVLSTSVGYQGGSVENPTYKQVCTDRTGHAEVVQVTFDPSKVSYDALLAKFFELHNPTQVNRQGPDHGTQYRTVIFFYSPEQEAAAIAAKAKLEASGKFSRPIATQIVAAPTFYPAEEYHQQYLLKRGQTVCH